MDTGINTMTELETIFEQIKKELEKAHSKHKPYNSYHEAYGIILEELDEFWDIVKMKESKRDKEKARKELIQVATTAIRTIINLELS